MENPEERAECCHVCWQGEAFEDNHILFCEDCDMCVHQTCYGIETVPEVRRACFPSRKLRPATRRNPSPPHTCNTRLKTFKIS
jgi:hypothetical protein